MPFRRTHWFALSFLFALGSAQAQNYKAGFVTTLGRDTVALESFSRTPSQLEGDLLVRVPGTVLVHYRIDLRADGTASRSVLDMDPLGVPRFVARRVTLDFLKDSVRVTVEESGDRRRTMIAVDPKTVPFFMTGFESSFGLYSSLGITELLVSGLAVSANDTVSMQSVGLLSGTQTKKKLMRRSATTADIDYFLVGWTRMTTDQQGRIQTVDMSGTTEKTQSVRTEDFNVKRAAGLFAKRDLAGRGIGVASPNQERIAKVAGATVTVHYGSPRKRGREILGKVVFYDRVWRTGANEATVLTIDRDATIGGTAVPAGKYSLWTIPTQAGVQLIINRVTGQWGTSYDAKQDLARVPMQTSSAAAAQEEFSITVVSSAGNAAELRMAWDTFVWSVPLVVK